MLKQDGGTGFNRLEYGYAYSVWSGVLSNFLDSSDVVVLKVACYVFVRLATLLLFTLRCVAGPHPSLIPSANIRLSHLSRASTMDIVGDLLRKVGVRFLLHALPFVISLLSYKLVHLNRRNSSKNTGV